MTSVWRKTQVAPSFLAKASPSGDNVTEQAAGAFEGAGRYDDAVALFDELIAKTASAALYNARCWVRAESGHNLEAALADCDAALKLMPGASPYLDSRGFVELRLGRFADAIRDYDAALAVYPDQAPSLFGRGVAELRQGDAQHGNADIAAAEHADAHVTTDFSRGGVTP